MPIDEIKIRVGDRELPPINLRKPMSKEDSDELLLHAVLASEIFYRKGQTVELQVQQDLKKRVKIKKPFVFHGFKERQLYVTIPITLDTLKGLGFISTPRP